MKHPCTQVEVGPGLVALWDTGTRHWTTSVLAIACLTDCTVMPDGGIARFELYGRIERVSRLRAPTGLSELGKL